MINIAVCGANGKMGQEVVCAVNSAEDMTDTETVIKLGDVNFDGKIKAADARLALRIAAGIDTPTEEEFIAADVNADGFVKAGDARLILRVSAGLDKESVFGAK